MSLVDVIKQLRSDPIQGIGGMVPDRYGKYTNQSGGEQYGETMIGLGKCRKIIFFIF